MRKRERGRESCKRMAGKMAGVHVNCIVARKTRSPACLEKPARSISRIGYR